MPVTCTSILWSGSVGSMKVIPSYMVVNKQACLYPRSKIGNKNAFILNSKDFTLKAFNSALRNTKTCFCPRLFPGNICSVSLERKPRGRDL